LNKLIKYGAILDMEDLLPVWFDAFVWAANAEIARFIFLVIHGLENYTLAEILNDEIKRK